MPKRVKQRRSTDENEVAFQLVQRSTQEPDTSNIGRKRIPASVSEYMAQIGSKGGRVGGKRRLQTLSAEERKKIAQQAARSRWKKKRPPKS